MANLSNINNKFLVTTGGAVGVGVTSPGSKLSIGGTTGSYDSGIGFQPTGTGARIYRTFIATDGSFRFDDVTAGYLTRLTISSTGNVGIGTTSPFDSKLQVVGKIRAAGGASGGYFFGSEEFDGGFYAPSDGNLAFSTNNLERIRIDGSGNVGIGTTSPSLKLHTVGVAGLPQSSGTSQVGAMRLQTGTSTVSMDMGLNSGSGGWIQTTNANDLSFNYPLLLNPNGGNVGIGTDSPSEKLHVQGAVGTTNGTSSLPTHTFYSDNNTGMYRAAADTLAFSTGGSERMRITSAGEMKIGEFGGTDPSRVQVGGNSTTARIIPYSDNVGYIGDSSHRWQAIYSTNGNIQTSDIREKTEIKPIQLGLDFVNDLNPVSYKWIENERLDASKDKRNHQGLIAQEVAETLEKHGVNKNDFGGLDIQKTDKYDDFHGMSYEQLVAPMIKAIQELTAKVERLEAK